MPLNTGPSFGGGPVMVGSPKPKPKPMGLGGQNNIGGSKTTNAPGMQTQTSNGPGGMIPAGPNPHINPVGGAFGAGNTGGGMGGGIVRGPGPMLGMPHPGMNTGVVGPRLGGPPMMGGMVTGMPHPGMMTPHPMGPSPSMGAPMMGGGPSFGGGPQLMPPAPVDPSGGLWGAYNNLSNERGVPGRQLFY